MFMKARYNNIYKHSYYRFFFFLKSCKKSNNWTRYDFLTHFFAQNTVFFHVMRRFTYKLVKILCQMLVTQAFFVDFFVF